MNPGVVRRTREITSRLGSRIGRRGYTLLVLGIFDLLYAWSIPDAATTRTPASLWLQSVMPLDAWAAIWACIGLVVLGGAFVKRDELSFAAAELLSVAWATIYAVGWIWHDVYRAWVSAAVWALVASWVFIISTWPERQWPDAG